MYENPAEYAFLKTAAMAAQLYDFFNVLESKQFFFQ